MMVVCVARSLPRVERVLYPAPPSINVNSGSSILSMLCLCIVVLETYQWGFRNPWERLFRSIVSPLFTIFIFYLLLCYSVTSHHFTQSLFKSALTLLQVYNYLQAKSYIILYKGQKPDSCAPCGIDTHTLKRLQLNPVHLQAIELFLAPLLGSWVLLGFVLSLELFCVLTVFVGCKQPWSFKNKFTR